MDKNEIEEIIEFSWAAFQDLSPAIKLELQKLKKKFISRAYWQLIEVEKRKREQYI